MAWTGIEMEWWKCRRLLNVKGLKILYSAKVHYSSCRFYPFGSTRFRFWFYLNFLKVRILFRPNFTCCPFSWFGGFISSIGRCLTVCRCTLNVRLRWVAGPSGAASDLCCGCRCLLPQSFDFPSDLDSEIRLFWIFFFSVGVGIVFSRAWVGGIRFSAGWAYVTTRLYFLFVGIVGRARLVLGPSSASLLLLSKCRCASQNSPLLNFPHSLHLVMAFYCSSVFLEV